MLYLLFKHKSLKGKKLPYIFCFRHTHTILVCNSCALLRSSWSLAAQMQQQASDAYLTLEILRNKYPASPCKRVEYHSKQENI